MDNRDEDEGLTAAERAFDALRAEVAAMRQALRSVPEVILKNQPADYTETLGAIAKNLEIVGNVHGDDRAASRDPHDAGAIQPSDYRRRRGAHAQVRARIRGRDGRGGDRAA